VHTNRIKEWKIFFSIIIIYVTNVILLLQYNIYVVGEKTTITRTTETRRGAIRETRERYRTVADRRQWRTDDVTDTNIIRYRPRRPTRRIRSCGGGGGARAWACFQSAARCRHRTPIPPGHQVTHAADHTVVTPLSSRGGCAAFGAYTLLLLYLQ